MQLLTPPGRFVQGNLFTPNTTDAEGKPLTFRNGPNAGQPRSQYFAAIAIEKNHPEWPAFYAEMHKIAVAAFPLLFPGGKCARPDFAMKVVDGDGIDQNGRPNPSREGFAGCWVLKMTNGFAPKVYTTGATSIITDPTGCKRGDYIRAYVSISGNESTQRPGLFVNLDMVEHLAWGEEIHSGPDAAAVFGSAPVVGLPAGASRTPVAPAATIAPPPVAVAPGGLPPAPPPVAVAPPPPPAPAVWVPRMTEKANGARYEACKAAGWTDEQLLAAGMIEDLPPF